ncbi:MAG: hypothetical protein IJR53_02565 [Bacteroidales bacterium]|nr:hypothetical protein [Bacteroidales bacterium]
MITLFLIIAFCIRKHFVREDACWSDKLLYYGFSVVFTPLIGPWVFKMLYDSEPCTDEEHRKTFSHGATYPGFL